MRENSVEQTFSILRVFLPLEKEEGKPSDLAYDKLLLIPDSGGGSESEGVLMRVGE